MNKGSIYIFKYTISISSLASNTNFYYDTIDASRNGSEPIGILGIGIPNYNMFMSSFYISDDNKIILSGKNNASYSISGTITITVLYRVN